MNAPRPWYDGGIMSTLGLVFPHQLFENSALIPRADTIFIIEDYLFFRQFQFHRQKLMLHRASMKAYESTLLRTHHRVVYLESATLLARRAWGAYLESHHPTEILCYEVVDTWLREDVETVARALHTTLTWIPTPSFFNTSEENTAFFKQHPKPFMNTFYEWQRRRTGILMSPSGEPEGGKFSFDTLNRKKFPAHTHDTAHPTPEPTLHATEARAYVDAHFPHAYGTPTDDLFYGHTHAQARHVLSKFLGEKLVRFGDYEDGFDHDIIWGYHSVLSPYLNIGLLTPSMVITQTVDHAANHPDITLNNIEGFIRQILGWREFMRAMYEQHGTTMRTSSFFGHTTPLPRAYWSATTGNSVVDRTITKVLRYGYCHHIERLMVLGNYMLLSEISPHDVYAWFMELFIDAYDWVMVPNIYGMSQFADGGICTTKPYIGASHYITAQSHYKKDGVWDKDFDDKFWAFLSKHRVFFAKNPRMRMLIHRLPPMEQAQV